MSHNEPLTHQFSLKYTKMDEFDLFKIFGMDSLLSPTTPLLRHPLSMKERGWGWGRFQPFSIVYQTSDNHESKISAYPRIS
jgi:hypothetical protein